MKKIIFLLIAVISCSIQGLSAQVPHAMTYQIMALNPESGKIMADEDIDIRIVICKGSPEGIIVFSQEFNVRTDKNGTCNLILNIPSNIDWSTGNYYFLTIINEKVCSAPKITSIPYAFYAEKAESLAGIISSKELIGTWNNAAHNPGHDSVETFVFNDDGTGMHYYSISGGSKDDNTRFTWILNKAGLLATIDSDKGYIETYFIIKMDENNIIIGFDGDSYLLSKQQ